MRKQAKKGGSQLPALFGAVEEALAEVPVQPLARQSGFERRKPRKLAPLALVQAACKLALQQSVSLRHWAILIGLAARTVLSKQDVKRRLGHGAVAFMALVLQDLLGPPVPPAPPGGAGRLGALWAGARAGQHDGPRASQAGATVSGRPQPARPAGRPAQNPGDLRPQMRTVGGLWPGGLSAQ